MNKDCSSHLASQYPDSLSLLCYLLLRWHWIPPDIKRDSLLLIENICFHWKHLLTSALLSALVFTVFSPTCMCVLTCVFNVRCLFSVESCRRTFFPPIYSILWRAHALNLTVSAKKQNKVGLCVWLHFNPCITIFPLEGHPGGHFIRFSPLEWESRGHFCCYFVSMVWEGGSLPAPPSTLKVRCTYQPMHRLTNTPHSSRHLGWNVITRRE